MGMKEVAKKSPATNSFSILKEFVESDFLATCTPSKSSKKDHDP